LVEQGQVPRGSYLIIENLDRLTREHIQPALLLVLNLLQAGIRIVQLKPVEMIFDDKSDTTPVMMMMMELSRGHSESAMKSERVRAAWEKKRERARSGQPQQQTKWSAGGRKHLTSALPAWVEEKDGELVLVLEKTAVVQRIFALAASGYGLCSIVATLTAEGVPAFGTREPRLRDDGSPDLRWDGRPKYRRVEGQRFGSGRWVKSHVARILADRRALGEYQPRRRPNQRERPADGAPIPGYFPAVVTEAEFLAARAGAAQRRLKAGRVRHEKPNPFAGLLRNARDGESYYVALRVEKGDKRHHILVNHSGAERRAPCVSFPFDVFEAAVLSLLREIDPTEIVGSNDSPDEAQALAGELAGVEARLAQVEAELMQGGDVPVLSRVARSLEERRKDLAARLAEAREKAAHPLTDCWAEVHTLSDALASAGDPTDARLRLRSAVRRVIDSVWLLVVSKGCDRVCAVQIWFAGGASHRDYLILYRPGRGNSNMTRPASWAARSFKDAGLTDIFDLRNMEHVRQLEADLLALPIPMG
jgi:hypothetical protein